MNGVILQLKSSQDYCRLTVEYTRSQHIHLWTIQMTMQYWLCVRNNISSEMVHGLHLCLLAMNTQVPHPGSLDWTHFEQISRLGLVNFILLCFSVNGCLSQGAGDNPGEQYRTYAVVGSEFVPAVRGIVDVQSSDLKGRPENHTGWYKAKVKVHIFFRPWDKSESALETLFLWTNVSWAGFQFPHARV